MLKRFPIDTLKIDQSFVHDITTDADEAAIVSAVIGMGKSLKQRVIADGVETREQLAFLRSQRCDEGQGFHFSHALSAKAFARFLVTGNEELRRQPGAKGMRTFSIWPRKGDNYTRLLHKYVVAEVKPRGP